MEVRQPEGICIEKFVCVCCWATDARKQHFLYIAVLHTPSFLSCTTHYHISENSWFFNCIKSIVWFYQGWLNLHISVVSNLIHFYPLKGISLMFNLQCSCISTFSLFLKAVYPVGVTEVWLCFMCKITYNSLDVDQIYQLFDTGICL